jgi:light-regulated signal transduction histidine kinase (bacteriophytochrome)
LYNEITERKQAESALRKSEQRFRALATASFAVVYRMSPDWSEMKQLSGKDFLIDTIEPKRNWLQGYIPPEEQSHVLDAINQAIGTRSIFELEHRVIQANGRIGWVFSHAVPIFEEDGEISEWFGAAQDITERKLAEQNLRHRTEELTAANRDLESFSYSVSHDLQNPLGIIGGFTNILIEDYAEKIDKEGQDFLWRISDGVKRMQALIKDMLALSRIGRQEVHRENVNLSAIARNYLQELENSEPQRKVELDVPYNIHADADPRLIHLALENLLRNAWKFTSKKEKTHIEFGTVHQDGSTVFFIRDNGVGFDMQAAQKIFEPFKRVHKEKEFGGTGVGLSIVQRVIERHGGKVWAEGKVGEGATFYFTLGSSH